MEQSPLSPRSSKVKARPCPYCGGDKIRLSHSYDESRARVACSIECLSCGSSGPIYCPKFEKLQNEVGENGFSLKISRKKLIRICIERWNDRMFFVVHNPIFRPSDN